MAQSPTINKTKFSRQDQSADLNDEIDIDDWEESSIYNDAPPAYCEFKPRTGRLTARVFRWIRMQFRVFVFSVFYKTIHKYGDDR